MTVRMRHTRSHTKNRRSHHALEKPAISKDKSGGVHLRHKLNSKTGTYKGRQVINMDAKLEKKAKKLKQRETSR